ncbi:hypothetical protein B0H17DRAFT_1155966 [Mycena rosella]|uniref:Chromo domain-containing protein n=1 Tax=Mycena rosella TaxID=1033263 RepID=A0AAD7GZQ1_MYCRO|nr:hypothetical protein B0H17DRAFT_1155966 [Mycena rosella]
MAPASPAASDVASDSGKVKKKSPSKAKDVEEVADSEAQSEADDGEEEEEEYEIEAILSAKKGQFEKNKIGYYVKWKGYDDEHNSWVMEDDANAPELIKAYWEKDKKKSPKKAPEPASKRTARKSVAAEDNDSDAGASAPAAKKRGRKSSVKAADKEGDPDERPAKKPRKTGEKKTLASASASGGAAASANEAPENIEIGDMSQHMHAPTWEHLIKMIDTVERVEEQLVVYFTLNTNEHVKEDSEVCHEKFPKKLLQFYEKNLRWKESSD